MIYWPLGLEFAYMTKDEALKLALEALEFATVNHWWGSSKIEETITVVKEALAGPPLPVQPEPDLTIVYQSGYYDGKKAALAKREWNFCESCGKCVTDGETSP